jgi:hypothetical protein
MSERALVVDGARRACRTVTPGKDNFDAAESRTRAVTAWPAAAAF